MRIFAILLVAINVVAAVGGTPASDSYEARSIRAAQFFKYKEWNSALAMYQLMLDERPDEAEYYYKAIVSSAMIGDSVTEMAMFERTQKCGISLDSVFNGVRRVSYAIGEAGAYCEFLQLIKSHQPWIKRKINICLLDYYASRNDSQHVIETAEELLGQRPRNIAYMKVLADAYVNLGRFVEAKECYHNILAVKNNDYDALLALGNYYALQLLCPDSVPPANLGREDLVALAQTYLFDAYNIRPTPYVKKLLEQLR